MHKIIKMQKQYGAVFLNVHEVKKLLKYIKPLYVYQNYYEYDDESEYMAITKIVNEDKGYYAVSYIGADDNEEDTMYVSKKDTHFELICEKKELIENFKLLSGHEKMKAVSKAPFTFFDN